MADVRHNLVVDTSQSQMSLRQMRQEMKNLQIEMSKTSDPTRFKQLEKEFAMLRNDMNDTSKAMKYLDPGELLGGYVKLAQGAVGSFAAITGAMSLFGNESEEIQEIEKKGMALIQTMMGLEQARQLLIDGGGRAQIKTLLQTTGLQIKQAAATATQTIAQKGATLATEGTTVATRLLGKAMMSLPIMWIIAGLAAIATATVFLVKAINSESDAEHRRNIAIKSYNKARNEAISSTAEQAVKLQLYSEIAEDTTKTEVERTAALNKLNEIMGTSLTLTDDLTGLTKLYTEALIDQATADTIVKRIGEINATLADGEKIKEESKGNWLEQGWSWVQRNLGGVQGQVSDMITTTNNMVESTEDLKNEAEDLTIQLKNLTAPLLANEKATKDAKKAQQDEADAIAAANAAWEKRKAALEAANAEYEKFLRDSRFNLEDEFGKIAFVYNEDVVKWKKKLDDKLISQEQYDNWFKVRTNTFNSDINKIQEKFDDDNEKAYKDSFDNKYNILLENRDNYINYLNELQSADNLSVEEFQKIEDRKRQVTYDFYNDLLKLTEENTKKDGIVTEEELKNIDEITAKRDEYVGVVTNQEEQITQTIEEQIQKRIALIQNYAAAYTDVLSSANSLISAIGERELIGVEANSRKGLEIRKKQAKQQLAMQVAMSAGLIAASVLQAIAQEGPIGLLTAAGLVSVGAAQVAAIIKAQNAIDQIDVEIANLADGGLVIGRGGPRSDSIPANLSNGEFVLNAAAVERLGLNLVNSLNKGASTAALIDYDLLAEKINEKQVYVTDRAITERQRTTKVTEKRTRL